MGPCAIWINEPHPTKGRWDYSIVTTLHISFPYSWWITIYITLHGPCGTCWKSWPLEKELSFYYSFVICPKMRQLFCSCHHLPLWYILFLVGFQVITTTRTIPKRSIPSFLSVRNTVTQSNSGRKGLISSYRLWGSQASSRGHGEHYLTGLPYGLLSLCFYTA